MDFSINLQSLNESVDTTNDWNSNLNSASSLPWADDELENHATLRVQQCLNDLENFLTMGHQNQLQSISFDPVEAEQWNKMITQFQLGVLLQESREQIDEKKLTKSLNGKMELEIQGQSYVHLASSKIGTTQTPRIRSAYPSKSAIQPTRIRSAYPMNRSPGLMSAGLTNGRRLGAKSGNATDRLHHPLAINGVRQQQGKNASDYLKIVDDTARLSIVQRGRSATAGGGEQKKVAASVVSSPSKNYTPLKRIKLQPPSLPKFIEGAVVDGLAVHALPPLLTEPSRQIPTATQRGRTTKGKTNLLKSAKPTTPSINSDSINYPLGRSAVNTTASAVQRSGIKPPPSSTSGFYRQQLYSLPSPPILLPPPSQPPIFRTGHIDVSIVGTSLSLFEPIVRPVRQPIALPKFRTT